MTSLDPLEANIRRRNARFQAYQDLGIAPVSKAPWARSFWHSGPPTWHLDLLCGECRHSGGNLLLPKRGDTPEEIEGVVIRILVSSGCPHLGVLLEEDPSDEVRTAIALALLENL